MSIDKARKQAFLLLDDIISKNKYSNLTLKAGLGGFDARDRAFITALVYGTLNKKISIDYIISLYAKGKIQQRIKNILRMGIYQIVYMDKIPDSAAVDTSAALAQSIGKGMLKGYINGVLRTVAREKENIPYPKEKNEYLSVKYSYPLFLVKELSLQIDDIEAFLSYEGTHNTCLRVNLLKNSVDEYKSKIDNFSSDGIYFNDCVYVFGKPEFIKEGLCTPQSEASMAAVAALEVKKGDRILDCCAAPGGKSVYIAQEMGEGSVVSLDKYEHRVELIKNNALRMGVEKMIDARQADMLENNSWLGEFDRVLVDAPCSGLGVVQNKPEIKNSVDPQALKELEEIQAKILMNASKHVKKGGILIYSTCTVRNAENINIVQKFLAQNSEFSLEGLPGTLLNVDFSGGYIQLYPHKNKTDGFFIARIKRN